MVVTGYLPLDIKTQKLKFTEKVALVFYNDMHLCLYKG